jgi:nucleotide-binding universal stress UspA family protein
MAPSPRGELEITAGTALRSPAPPSVVVVGYDHTPAARRALDQAVNLLSDRPGTIEVVFVAQVPVGAGLSREGLAAVEQALNEQTRALAADVRERLLGEHYPWHFQRRSGGVAEELIAAAQEVRDCHRDSASVGIVVGGPTHRHHHSKGSVAASLIRTNRFPVLVIP